MLADKLRAASLTALPLPEFVSSSSTQGSGPGLNIPAPTGIQDGDLLVVLLLSDAGTAIFTPATGFNLVRQNQIDATACSLCVGSKIAASESGNYSFPPGTASATFGAILVYRNATKVNTVGVAAAPSTNGTAGVVAAEITPTYAGTLLGLWGHYGTSKTITTLPSGMTQRVASTTTDFFYVYDLAQQAAAATGTKTLVWGGANSNLAPNILFQITNEPTVAPDFVASASTQNTGTGGDLIINKPTGTVEGDLMVAVMACNGPGGSTWTGDTGWTEVADLGSLPSLRVAYKVAGASEGSSYTFTASQTRIDSGSILTYRYANYDTIGTFAANTDPLLIPSISPSESQCTLIAFGGRDFASITLGTPTGMTARVTNNDATIPSYIVCDQTVAKGLTGTRSMSTGSTAYVAGIMLSIKPTRSL